MARRNTETKAVDQIVRVFSTDLDGNKKLLYAMTKIKGVSLPLANAALHKANVQREKKALQLTDEEINKIEDVLKNPAENFPVWMLNRRKDVETGEDTHQYLSDLTFGLEKDMRRLKKIKSYRGMRHQKGLPVRGQRTRSNFRRNKGKATGVKRAKTAGRK